ncbi:MAG TPA: hypothetical protein PLZ84_01315, partial [Clostridia bacterium]|nr:hypothetical protein [Clostridia bacterium]
VDGLVRVKLTSIDGSVGAKIGKIQIEPGPNATAHEPYRYNQMSITGTYRRVGDVYDEVDSEGNQIKRISDTGEVLETPIITKITPVFETNGQPDSILRAWGANTTVSISSTGSLPTVTYRYPIPSVRTIAASERYSPTTVSDTITKVTKVEMQINDSTYSVGTNEGMTLTLRSNPLLQSQSAETIQAALTAILNEITHAEYTPFKIDIIGDPSLQPGDYVKLTGTGSVSGDPIGLITHSVFKYRGKHSLRAAGKENVIKSSYSQTEKVLNSIRANVAQASKSLQNLLDSLGDMAYEDAVELAKLGETIIEGGYFKTGLVDASRIDTGYLSADRIQARSLTADKLAANTITAEAGVIAEAAITNAMIASISAEKITAGILDAARIGAKSITVDKLYIGDMSNLFQNNPDTNPGQFAVYEVGGVKYFATAAAQYSGITFLETPAMDFIPGQQYKFRMYAKSELTNQDLTAAMRYYYTDGTSNTAGTATATVSTSGGTYDFIVSTGTPTAGKIVNGVEYYVIKNGLSSAGRVYIRDIIINKMVGTVTIENGAITGEKFAADIILANKTITGPVIRTAASGERLEMSKVSNMWGYRGFNSSNTVRAEYLFDRINFYDDSGTLQGVLTGSTGAKVPPGSVNRSALKLSGFTSSIPALINNATAHYDIGQECTFFPSITSGNQGIQVRARYEGADDYNAKFDLFNGSGSTATVYVRARYIML